MTLTALIHRIDLLLDDPMPGLPEPQELADWLVTLVKTRSELRALREAAQTANAAPGIMAATPVCRNSLADPAPGIVAPAGIAGIHWRDLED